MVFDTPMIMTVLGPVNPEDLGPTYMHEHVILDGSFSGNDPNKILDEEDTLSWEMGDIFRAGGRTVVDCTCTGLSPDPAALKRIAKASGINIIASTGFYRYIIYPDYIGNSNVDQLAKRLIDDCKNGLDNTGVRPGMFAEFASHDPKIPTSLGHGDAEPPNKNVEKVFRAVSRAHRTTNLPITTHTPAGKGAEWQIDIFKQEGVDLSKIIIGHVGLIEPDMDHARWILEQSVNVGIDGIGYDQRDGLTFLDHDKANLVKTFIEWGHIDQITISLDMTRKYHLKKYGGHGFAMLMDRFVPLMRQAGVTDEQVNQILIENPKRILTPAVKCQNKGNLF